MEDNSFLNWLATDGLTIAITVAVIAFSKPIINHFVNRFFKKALGKHDYATSEDYEKRRMTLSKIVSATLWVLVLAMGIIVILNNLGVDTAALIAGLGIAGFAIGFGSQELVKDFIAGTFIIMENQYRVGDYVEIADKTGTVVDVTMRETILRDTDGSLHHIPNGQVTTATNKTFEFSKMWMNVGVAYDTDIEKAKKTIDKVGTDMVNDKDWKDKIDEAPRFIRVDEFGATAIELRVSSTTKPGDQAAVAGEFRRRIVIAFEKDKIVIAHK